jgi:tagatose 6-phosphate kinase
MIKPNEREFSDLVDRSVSDEAEMVEILNEWKTYGIPVVVVTLGDRGAIVLVDGEIYRVTAPAVSAVNPVGSGDAFTAGMASGFEKGWPIEETLKFAAATGAANALEKRAGVIDLNNLERLKNEVQIEKR